MRRYTKAEKAGTALTVGLGSLVAGSIILSRVFAGPDHEPKTSTEAQPFDEGKVLVGTHIIKSMEQDFPENTPIYDTPDPKTQKVIDHVQAGGKMEVQGGLSFVVDGQEYTGFAQDPTKVHDLASLEQQEGYVRSDAATFSGSPEGFRPTTVVISPSGELSLSSVDGQPVNTAVTVTAGPNTKHTR